MLKENSCDAQCNEFRELTRKHFDDEVEILRKAGFPRLESHIKTHEKTLEECGKIFSNCGETCKDDNPSCPCMEDLSFLTLDHIVRNDLDFKSHLQTRNLANSGA